MAQKSADPSYCESADNLLIRNETNQQTFAPFSSPLLRQEQVCQVLLPSFEPSRTCAEDGVDEVPADNPLLHGGHSIRVDVEGRDEFAHLFLRLVVDFDKPVGAAVDVNHKKQRAAKA